MDGPPERVRFSGEPFDRADDHVDTDVDRRLVDVEVRGVVTRRVARADAEIRRLPALSLNAADQIRGVLAAAELLRRHPVDGVDGGRGRLDGLDHRRVVLERRRLAVEARLVLHVVHRRRAVNDVAGPLEHVLVEVVSLAADLDAHGCLLADHVLGVVGCHLPHVDPGRAVAVSRDSVEVADRRRRRLEGVSARVRLAAGVSGLAGEADVEFGVRQRRVVAGDDRPGRLVQPHVNREQTVDVVEVARFGHRLAAATPFLGRLKEQFERAVEAAVGERARHTEPDGGVCVVAAGVHLPRMAAREPLGRRPVVVVHRLLSFQRVDVGPEPDRRAVAERLGRYHARDVAHRLEVLRRRPLLAGAFARCGELVGRRHAHPRVGVDRLRAEKHLVSERLELGGEQRRGAELLPAALGVSVKIAANRRQRAV